MVCAMEAQINLLDNDGVEEPKREVALLLTVMGGLSDCSPSSTHSFMAGATSLREHHGFIGAITSGGSGIWFYLIALRRLGRRGRPSVSEVLSIEVITWNHSSSRSSSSSVRCCSAALP